MEVWPRRGAAFLVAGAPRCPHRLAGCAALPSRASLRRHARRGLRAAPMARPVWSGTLSFGLLNIPVSLMTGERKTDISFRMLDSRNHARVRYERVTAETGAALPRKDTVTAYEYDKAS